MNQNVRPGNLDLGVAPEAAPLADSAAYRDTIGAYTYYEGLRSMRVAGYGLVAGLGGEGASDCPRNIYNRLVQRLYKRHNFAGSRVGEITRTPEELIKSRDTAVVIVQANIPAGAVRGSRFDVSVSALPGTQTKSLIGGRLYATDLEILRPVSSSKAISGQVLAQAAGPLFINPFSGGDSATSVSPRHAVIVNGGLCLQDRRLRLVLMRPSYQLARRIQDRVNAFFPGPRLTADAVSPSFVRLRVPEEYSDDTAHFLGLVRALYLSRDPVFQATRARVLADEIKKADAPHASISLALEGLGRVALPALDDLYADPRDYAAFHAAAAGLRLGDHIAGDAMTRHAADADCPFRFQAIRALGEVRGMGGTAQTLRNLLHADDPRVQVAAYEALLQRGDSTIDSRPVGGDNFMLDLVVTDRPGFIYVKRSGSRRIALFGSHFRCVPPVLYRADDGRVVLNAQAGDDQLTVLRVVVASGAMSPAIPAPFDLPPLIELLGGEADVTPEGEVTGVGLDYTAVVRALHRLCTDRTINARFVLEQPNTAEIFGPPRPAGRRESEL